MRIPIIIISFICLILLQSCWEEDQPLLPYTPSEGLAVVALEQSIYSHQIYFDLSSGNVVAENSNNAWAIAFECADTGYHIRINTADYWGLTRTGKINFDSVYTNSQNYLWRSDRSDGNPDSTAFGKWFQNTNDSKKYSNEVFLLGQDDGLSFTLKKKIQLIYVDDTIYKFRLADPDKLGTDTLTIRKNPSLNYIQFSVQTGEVVELQPNKSDWDLLFGQYQTVLFTDDGIPTAYIVRGTLLNEFNVAASLDTLKSFNDINYDEAVLAQLRTEQDYIGHDWKSVTIDESSNAAEYKVRPGYTYIIKDTEGDYYKLRFKSFFNQSGAKGYPVFEYAKLNPE